MRWFWYFLVYSFLGFLLEVLFARAIRSEKLDRKCFILLPLCPVYGLGALAILAVARLLRPWPILMALGGGVAATAVEYFTGLFYQHGLGVAFWNYDGLPMNLGGQICLPFTVAWSVLSLILVYQVHPAVSALMANIPVWLVIPAALVLLTDGAMSLFLLKVTGTTECLKWYARQAEPAEP